MIHGSHAWDEYVKPFQIAENLYFVGTDPSSHLIDTGEGLILLDSGYFETLYLVMDNIRELGFSPYDIKYILHTHGHIDHIGGTLPLVELTGAKTIIGRGDLDYVTGDRDLTFAKELGMDFDGFFQPDILLDDGDKISLGNITIECIHTPGHTEGTMSYFFNIVDHGRTLRVGMHGGVGINSMERAFLERYGLPLSLRDQFRYGLHQLKNEHVDIILGNHRDQTATMEKYNKKLAGDQDAFIDDSAWTTFLCACEQDLDQLLMSEISK